MLWEIVGVSVLFLLIPLVFLIIRWIVSYRLLKRYGINGPSPEFYHGNTRQIRKMGVMKFVEINLRKYGNVFGFYIGMQPNIIVKDLEMLKQIMVKQFDAFTDRPRTNTVNLLVKTPSLRANSLFGSQGADWKRQRKILSKSFNAVNLSKMASLIERSCDSLAERFHEHADSGESFDLWKLYGLYTMEVILATGFGHKVDVINGQADDLAESSASLFAFAREGVGFSATTVLSNFPCMEWYIRRQMLKYKATRSYLYIEQKAEELIRNRLEGEEPDNHHQDLLQLLVEARADSDDEDDLLSSNDPYEKKLSDMEIIRTSVSFLMAGHETTNNALAYVSYLLALHPEEQEKVLCEIDEFCTHKPDATLYEVAQSLTYIDMVIQESLRMFPPAPLTARCTSRTIEINGQVFPEGSIVMVPIIAIHHSPELWPEPSIFKPCRFLKEQKEKRHPMAHMPFGWGPRSCIGMRLALMEAKMALIAIMKHYKFVEAPDTEKPLKTSYGITMVPTNGVYLTVDSRQGTT